MKKQLTISAHLIQFCRFLRSHNFNLGPIEEVQALNALKIIPFNKAEYFKNALQSTLVKSKTQFDLFDNLYLQYWSEIFQAENSKNKNIEENLPDVNKPQKAPPIQVIKDWLYGNKENEEIEIASISKEDVFTEQDFSSFSKEDMSEALKLSKLLVNKLSNKKGRRQVATKNKDTLDLRNVIRKNISKSDEYIHLSYNRKKIEKLNLVLICDVSRSMEMYAKFLIQFMFGLNQASTRIETFVFSTKLERITNSLRNHDLESVLEAIKNDVDSWSGGTKIGSSLLAFGHNYSGIVLNQRTKVVILSDGWDTEDPEIVVEAMKIIKRKCDKIIWLNPLAGNPNFSPDVACLKAAMPYIDLFQAANNIESLRRLIAVIK